MLKTKKIIDEWRISPAEIDGAMKDEQNFFEAMEFINKPLTEEKKLLYAVKNVANERIAVEIKKIKRREKQAIFIAFVITFFVLLPVNVILALLAAAMIAIVFLLLMVFLIRPDWYDESYYSEINSGSYADAYYGECHPIREWK